MKCHVIWRHLVNSKADRVQAAVQPFVSPRILLHQPQQKSASVLPVHRVVVHVLQQHHELRVGRESG